MKPAATVRPPRKPLGRPRLVIALTDLPLVARDWDTPANDRLLSSLTAGSSYDAHWKCHRCGHAWVAPVVQRTCRQTRCQRCSTERADGKNSLAAVHPELVAEWDAEANAPLRPNRIKATDDEAVTWRCREDETHPANKMSPFARAKRPIGWPVCRKKKVRPTTETVATAA